MSALLSALAKQLKEQEAAREKAEGTEFIPPKDGKEGYVAFRATGREVEDDVPQGGDETWGSAQSRMSR